MNLPDLDPAPRRGVEEAPVDKEDESRAGFPYGDLGLVLVQGEGEGGADERQKRAKVVLGSRGCPKVGERVADRELDCRRTQVSGR